MEKFVIAADVAQQFGDEVVSAVKQAERNEVEDRGTKSGIDWGTAAGIAQLIVACVQTALMLRQKDGSVDANKLESELSKTQGSRPDDRKTRKIAAAVKVKIEARAK